MDSRFDKPTEPVCKFGPGGDFTSFWPGEPSRLSEPAPNSLAKVLSSIAEIISMMLGSEPYKTSALTEVARSYLDKNPAEEVKKEYEHKNSSAERPAYTTSATIIKSDSFFSDQPRLFTDNRRISIRAVHKQKHRIRTCRRASKKKTSFSVPGQGSLFEANFKGTKTA